MNTEFLAALQELRHAFNDANFEKATKLCGPLREKTIPILKAEWERVKRGERVYRVSKGVAVAVLVCGVIGAGTIATQWFISWEHSTTTRQPAQPKQ
jgi:hypothetical protein